MEVLGLLLSNPNHLVERKRIISEVWQDYGGADESLNQAISHLRKIFDTDQESDEPSFIETITKKGYRLNVPVNMEDTESRISTGFKNKINKLYLIIGLLIIIIGLLIYFLVRSSPNDVPAPEADRPLPENSSVD